MPLKNVMTLNVKVRGAIYYGRDTLVDPVLAQPV